MQGKWKKQALAAWHGTIKPFAMILVVLFSLRSAVADWNDVPTGSMKPTILEGDRIFVNKLAYDLKVPFTKLRIARWGDPQRGDVVVFFSPDDDVRMVKRVVGVPGDRLDMNNNRLYINGEPARYEPLDAAIVDQIDENERPRYRFSAEKIGSGTHPVMVALSQPASRSINAIVVPAGYYFMLGDNRDNSRDSRWFGLVERDRIVGRASRVLLSVNPDRYYMPRWHRFFLELP